MTPRCGLKGPQAASVARRTVFVRRLVAARRLLIGLIAAVGPVAAAAAERSGQAPEPVVKTLRTRDGVELRISYFPSDAKTEASAVILLHDSGESRAVMGSVAPALQSPLDPTVPRRAVVAVDLRGHGDSKRAIGFGGASVELDASQFRQQDYELMVAQDIEAVRAFLVAENDARQLNLNKLALVGAGMGADLAALWAADDWEVPPLAVRKQGQDVKALALISPIWTFKGLSLNVALRQPDVRARLSLMLAFGSGSRDAARDARNVLRNVEKFHPEPPPTALARKSLFVEELDTALQGSALLTNREFQLVRKLDAFLTLRLDRQAFPWVGRKVQ